jgi:aerobic-type carbon monoxide dehydrogenase small subunit (CoxS/CutS family)
LQITVSVNGEEHTRDVEPRLLLVHFLRDTLGLTGTHWGCDTSNCGTRVVLMDGEPAKSCTVLAATAERYEITTVEGLERDGVWKLMDRRAAEVVDVPVAGRVPRDVDTWDDYEAVLGGRAG